MVEGFKNTEVGFIPIDWELYCLDILTYRIGDGIHSTPKYTDNGDYFFVNGNNLINGKIAVNADTKRVSNEEAKQHFRDLNTNTVLLSINGTIGNVAFYQDEKIVIGKSAAYMNLNEKISKEYFFQVLQAEFIKKYFENELTGSTIKNLGLGSIRNTLIPLPPTKSEQTAIATALNDADALINKLEQLLAKKRNIKTGAMQELLKPKEGWEVKKFGEIGECIIGLTYSPSNVKKDGILVLRSSNIKGNKLAFVDNVFVNVEVSEKLKVRKGDVLICVRNGSRNLIGKCAYIDGRAIGVTFGAFMSVFRSPFNDYVFHVLQSNYIQKQIEETIGATINQLTNKNLNSFEIPFPNLEEQTRIAQILSDMDSEIQELERKIEKYKMLKQGMMQNLLTGKIRLM